MPRRAAPPPPPPKGAPPAAAFSVAPRRRTAAEAVDAGRAALLREAAATAARVVALHGKAYLPIFLRMEAELARLEAGDAAEDAALRRARAMAEAAPADDDGGRP